MPTYIDLPIDTDPQDILNDAYTFLQSVIPGWEPAAGNLDVWLLMALASAAAETRDVASAVPTSIFRYFGASLVGLPPIDAAPSTTTVTINVVDNQGYTIPVGTQMAIAISGNELIPFVTIADTVIPPGSTSATPVTIQSVNPGLDTAGLGAIAGPVLLLDPLAFISSISQLAVTSGGVDAELDSDYLNRLASWLTLLTPRPILPADYATLVRASIVGVFRAVAIDGYDPASNTYNNAREVSVAAIDATGAIASSAVKAAMLSYLNGLREVNFIVNVIDPTINLINVTYTAKALPGVDKVALLASVNAALTAYLNPVTWGASSTDPTSWTNSPTVRLNKIIQVIEDVTGVDYLVSVTQAINPAGLAAADLTLTGVAPLAKANTLTGIIT